jgi:tetratricopeptide (TPR) repeat protein
MSVWLWMILTIVLISLPIGILSFFFSKKIFKKLTHVLGKIDTFDALVRFKKEIMYLYRKRFSGFRQHVDKHSVEQIKYNENGQTIDIIDEILKPKISSSDFASDAIIDNEEHRTTVLKKRKLLEKIIYDALGLRKEGKLDEYEKKVIEGLAIDSEDKDLNKLLADLYFTMGNHKKALPILKKIVEIDPKDHKAIRQI